MILDFVKNYFLLMLILFLISYLAPQENYRKYFNFFIGAMMIAILIQPLHVFLNGDARDSAKKELDQIREKMESIEYCEKGENIFEQFLGETKETE